MGHIVCQYGSVERWGRRKIHSLIISLHLFPLFLAPISSPFIFTSPIPPTRSVDICQTAASPETRRQLRTCTSTYSYTRGLRKAGSGRSADPTNICSWLSWGQKLHMTLINKIIFVVSNNTCIYHLHLQGGPQNWHTFCTPYNFIKYWPISKQFSLSESEENL